MVKRQEPQQSEAPVLVVGGSVVGLSMAVFLRAQGVPVKLVEQHRGIHPHPRARGYNVRTAEIFRAFDLEDEIRAASSLDVQGSGVLQVESLHGREIGWLSHASLQGPGADYSGVSPTRWIMCPQDRLEQVLLERARALGAEIRHGVELVRLEERSDHVIATLRDVANQGERQLCAQYVVAADGGESRIRSQLGIAMEGPGVLGHDIGILFRAELSQALRGRRFAICQILQEGFRGTLSVDGDRVVLSVPFDPGRESPSAFSPERCVGLVRAAVGDPELVVEVERAFPWTIAASVASTFQKGRVFLVGDAAHLMPPAGAFGANTGIQDAYNLAWKLAAVCKGAAGPNLLRSYHHERHPTATITVAQALARARAMFGPARAGASAELLDDATLMFGHCYGGPSGSSFVTSDDDPLRVGMRIPHFWIEGDTGRCSSLDVVASRFVLLAGPEGETWREAAHECVLKLGIEVGFQSMGAAALSNDKSRLDVEENGAVLVRPDGHVSWVARSLLSRPGSHLEEALRDALSLEPPA